MNLSIQQKGRGIGDFSHCLISIISPDKAATSNTAKDIAKAATLNTAKDMTKMQGHHLGCSGNG